MAFPTATVSTGIAQTSSATGNRNVTIPTCASGDLLIAVVTSDGNPAFAGSLTTNMTSFVAKANNSALVTSQCFYRICDGSETSPWVLNLNAVEAATVAMILIPAASWHGTTPPEAVAWVNTDTANPNPPSLDPSGWGTEDTLWIAVTTYDQGQRTVTAYPTNYSDDQSNIRGNATGGCGIGIATRPLNAASEDPGTFTLSVSEDTLTTTIAVRPASAPPLESAYRDAVLALNPVGYWPLDDIGETVATDLSGNAHHGTYQTAAVAGDTSPVVDDYPDAVEFDGSTQHVDVASHADFDFGDGPMSGMAWARRAATGDAFQVILATGGNGGIGASIRDSNSKFTIATIGDTNIVEETGTTTADGFWHFWVWTRAGSGTGQTLVYKDGVDVTSETATDAVTAVDFGPVIGADASGALEWIGDLCHAAFFDSVLTPTEISDLYALGLGVLGAARSFGYVMG